MNRDFIEIDSESFENIKKNIEIITDLINKNTNNPEEYSDLMEAIHDVLSTKISNILINDPESKILYFFNVMVESQKAEIIKETTSNERLF